MTSQLIDISTSPEMKAIIEPINDDYEYIQYNEKLRLIHSINDDMYQMQSIINACNSKKLCKDWFKNKQANEIIDELRKTATTGIHVLEKLYE